MSVPARVRFPRVVTPAELAQTGILIPRLRLRDRLTVYASSLAVIGAFYWAPIGLVCTLTYLVARWRRISRRKKIILLAIIIALFYVPRRRALWVRRMWWWAPWLRYLAVHVVFDDTHTRARAVGSVPTRMQTAPVSLPEAIPAQKVLHSEGPAIMCVSPHGVFPFPIALSLVRGCMRVFGILSPVVADVTLRVPAIGHLIAASWGVKANNAEIGDALRQGRKLVFAPGGVAEIFGNHAVGESRHRPERIILRGRKGVVRLAIESGAPLIPVYAFGASEIFLLLPLSRIAESLSRILRASIIFFVGRHWLPIPLRVPLMYAVGEAIPVPHLSNPPPEMVEAVHARLLAAMGDLFEKYKGLYSRSMAHRSLQIE